MLVIYEIVFYRLFVNQAGAIPVLFKPAGAADGQPSQDNTV
jgi:hypothetical protein